MDSISVTDLHTRMAAGPVDLIDVRSPSEFAACHAVGARNVPLGSLDAAALGRERQSPETPMYIICQSGGRSMAACSRLAAAGLSVVNVAGGTSAWAAHGLPVARDAGAARGQALRQLLLMVAMVAGLFLLMPCSPLSVWGSAWCPTGTAAVATAVPTSGPFADTVVAASRQRPVLVDFHAAWCGPCQQMKPEIAALMATRGDRLALAVFDVDAHGDLARNLGVSSIPDLRLWHDGIEIARVGGYRDRAQLAAWIDAALEARRAR
jgi:rhodanese-related sulfurtransferase/thiol-disulfide isomerase/thioredoxin